MEEILVEIKCVPSRIRVPEHYHIKGGYNHGLYILSTWNSQNLSIFSKVRSGQGA
jgi:hypothetical protein